MTSKLKTHSVGRILSEEEVVRSARASVASKASTASSSKANKEARRSETYLTNSSRCLEVGKASKEGDNKFRPKAKM